MNISMKIDFFIKGICIILLLGSLGCGISAYISLTTYIPQYKATATIIAINEVNSSAIQQTYADILAGQQLVKEFKEIIRSKSVTEKVIEELKLYNMSPEELAKDVTVKLVSDTRIIEIEVLSVSPKTSAKLANSFTEVFKEKIQEIMKEQNIVVIDKAEEGSKPVEPQHKKNVVIGGCTGLLMGFLIVYLRQELDKTVKSTEDIEKLLEVKVLGVIPKSKKKTVSGSRRNRYNRIYNVKSPPIEEAYKALRVNVKFNTFNSKCIAIAIVGFAPKQGKTFVAINLAISFAKDNKRVLLVDADLRKPLELKRLAGYNSEGLASYLSYEQISYEEIILKTNIENLSYVPAGRKPHNPTELLDSFRFTEFMMKVRESYDIVLVDTPCLGNVIDGAIIASKTDGSLIVIAPDSVDCSRAKALKRQLEEASSTVVGAVFNKASDYFDKNNDYFNEFSYFDSIKDIRKYTRQKFVRPNKGRWRTGD
ncbi:polysaccharide biosynthesis tyrosine autokinase [Ruminiclostridium josui]|uniref:polysaccharide biosynthesis tyrosine autokinase n=1 Tax=Ruminiclostridium josui TaxID=1499 RepID=UPI000465A14D|nr:polysaccharide biosynthesis tyrosine autokinase [Ruminiclostridium josui]